jgi:hypothetical protein
VRLTGRYQEGERHHAVVQIETVECRSRVMSVAVVIDGEQPPPIPPTAPDHLRLAASNVDVAEVLGIMGQQEPLNWVDYAE